MKVQSLVKGLPLLAQMMISDPRLKGVRIVRTHDDTASTDGKVIHMPDRFLMPKADMNEADEAQWRDYAYTTIALLAHEVGHVIHTQFNVLNDEQPKGHRKHLLNLLEDPRIDNCQVRDRPGFDEMYQVLGEHLVREGLEQPVPADAAAIDALFGWAHFHVRSTLRDEGAYAPLRDAAKPIVIGHFGEALCEGMEILLEEAGGAHSTRDVLNLTDRILDYLKQAAAPPEPPSDSSTAKDADDAEQGKAGGPPAAGQGNNPPSEESGQDGQGQPSGSPASSPDQAPTAANGSGLTQEQAKALADALQQDSKDVAEARLAAIREKQSGDTAKQANAGAIAASIDPSKAGGDGAGGDSGLQGLNLGSGTVDAVKVNAVMSAARLKLRNLLKGESDEDTSIREQGRRISQRHAYRIAVDDLRVFKQRTEGPGVNTAVFLLVDVSGSMGGGPIQVAREAAYATAMALKGIDGVTTAIGVFPGNGLVMPFGSTPMRHADRFRFDCWGGTPMAEGMQFAATALLQQKEPRKLMIVVTDGQPDRPDAARATQRMLANVGIESVGIGIGTSSVNALFPASAVIGQVEDLPVALFTALREQLVLRRRAA